MEMEINVINNKNFTKVRGKRKRNFILCHFQVESKPHERIDLLITTWIFTRKKEKKVF